MRQLVLILLAVIAFACQQAKYPTFPEAKNMKTKNMVTIPELVNENIPGAPVLSHPVHVQGTLEEIMTEKHGYAYPALFDWNRDGINDLLIGEFKTGNTGSNIQVHLNRGTNEWPEYTGEFEYAKDINGDTITAYYWCCIGIHPRFVDLTGDGIDDLVTGSYNPGKISMWEGVDNGFKPVVELEQLGYLDRAVLNLTSSNINSNDYWNYSSVDFADFNGDGLYDLFVAGSGGFRCALNIGTKQQPIFGYRELLLDVEGQPLMIANEEHAKYCISGDMKSYLTAVDWDNDGVLDLLATSSYAYKEQNPVEFYRGVKTDKGIRFEHRKPLFKRKDGHYKTLPGSGTQIKVADYNNDGVNDLLLGLSILTVNGYEMVDSLAWMHLDKYSFPRIGKDLGAGYGDPNRHEEMVKVFSTYEDKSLVPYIYTKPLDEQIRQLYSSRHRGYVYVLYGEKPNSIAEAKEVKAKDKLKNNANEIELIAHKTIGQQNVKINIERSDAGKDFNQPITIRVTFEMEDGWYLYADSKQNREEGYIITDIKTKSDLTQPGTLITPTVFNPGGTATYQGKSLVFEHNYLTTRKWYAAKNKEIELEITYQTCNKDMCLAPVTISETVKF